MPYYVVWKKGWLPLRLRFTLFVRQQYGALSVSVPFVL